MTVVETVLVFAGIPLSVFALVVIAVYGRSTLHQPNRYRPGKAWTYPPSWYVPHPEAIEDVVPDRVAVAGGAGDLSGSRGDIVAAGGASGEW